MGDPRSSSGGSRLPCSGGLSTAIAAGGGVSEACLKPVGTEANKEGERRDDTLREMQRTPTKEYVKLLSRLHVYERGKVVVDLARVQEPQQRLYGDHWVVLDEVREAPRGEADVINQLWVRLG